SPAARSGNRLYSSFVSDGFVTAGNKSNTSIISLQPLREKQHRKQINSPNRHLNILSTQSTCTKFTMDMDYESNHHNYAYTLQNYLLWRQHPEHLCTTLEQPRPRTASTGTLSTISSPSTSPVRTSIFTSQRRHSRSGGPRRGSRQPRQNGWEDQL